MREDAIDPNKEGKITNYSKFGQFSQTGRNKILDTRLLLLYGSMLSIIFVISGLCYPFQFKSCFIVLMLVLGIFVLYS